METHRPFLSSQILCIATVVFLTGCDRRPGPARLSVSENPGATVDATPSPTGNLPMTVATPNGEHESEAVAPAKGGTQADQNAIDHLRKGKVAAPANQSGPSHR